MNNYPFTLYNKNITYKNLDNISVNYAKKNFAEIIYTHNLL